MASACVRNTIMAIVAAQQQQQHRQQQTTVIQQLAAEAISRRIIPLPTLAVLRPHPRRLRPPLRPAPPPTPPRAVARPR